MNLLRRSSAPTADEDDGDGPAASAPAPPSRRAGAANGRSSSDSQPDKQAKAAQRSRRMALVREARKASSAMVDPEPTRGLLVGLALIALGVYSFLSTDVYQAQVKLHGKTTTVPTTITHPAQAITLVVLAVGATVTIYWRRRYLTGIAFMLTAALGMSVPFPSGLSDLIWVTFLVPAAFVLWMLMFRMNKEQKAWLTAHSPASGRNGPAASGRAPAEGKRAATSRSRRGRDEPVVTSNGRALPPNSGRYTRPHQKAKAGQRKP